MFSTTALGNGPRTIALKQRPTHERKQKLKPITQCNTQVERNSNMAQLKAGYLFPEIARIRNKHLEKNPDAKIISLGIGDTTVSE